MNGYVIFGVIVLVVVLGLWWRIHYLNNLPISQEQLDFLAELRREVATYPDWKVDWGVDIDGGGGWTYLHRDKLWQIDTHNNPIFGGDAFAFGNCPQIPYQHRIEVYELMETLRPQLQKRDEIERIRLEAAR